MPVPIVVYDGAQPFGTTSPTVSNGQTYIMDSFTPSRPTAVATDRKANGSPNRWRSTADFDTFTAVLQAPTGTANWPAFGDYFTYTQDDRYGSETWVFDPITATFDNDPGSIRKINATGRKAYNGNPTTVNS